MKKILFYLGAFALLITSCVKNQPVPISDITPPTPPTPPEINYNTAECTYYGDINGSGAAFFLLNLYQSSNPSVGVFIRGWCTKPNGFAAFKLDEGTYSLASSGAVRTYVSGSTDANTGTTLYNAATGAYTHVTGGDFTVQVSGSTYTIATHFTGREAATGNTVNNIRINFSGSIRFVNNSTIERSTYVATGKPEWKSPAGPSTWSGIIEPRQFDSGEKYYRITNWCDLNMTVYCDYYEDGTIQIDNYSQLQSDETYYYNFDLAYIDGNKLYIINVGDHVVHYNPITRVLDFTETITRNGVNYEALVGIARYYKDTEELERTYSDFYSGLKLQLSPVQTTSGSAVLPQSDNLTGAAKSMNINRSSTIRHTIGKDMQIVVEEKENSNRSTMGITK